MSIHNNNITINSNIQTFDFHQRSNESTDNSLQNSVDSDEAATKSRINGLPSKNKLQKKSLYKLEHIKDSEIFKPQIYKIFFQNTIPVQFPETSQSIYGDRYLTGQIIRTHLPTPSNCNINRLMQHIQCSLEIFSYTLDTIRASGNHPNRHGIKQESSSETFDAAIEFTRSAMNHNYLGLIEQCYRWNIGNCGELSQFALTYRTNIPVHQIRFTKNDHVFLVVGLPNDREPTDPKTWGNDAVVLDIWSGLIVPGHFFESSILGYFGYFKVYDNSYTNPYAPIVDKPADLSLELEFPFCNIYVQEALKNENHRKNYDLFNRSICLQYINCRKNTQANNTLLSCFEYLDHTSKLTDIY